jgi:hypothetical protein
MRCTRLRNSRRCLSSATGLYHLKEREDFPGKRLSMLARLAAQSLIEVIGNIFDV